MKTAPRKTELLAPAGSLDAFFAAIDAGADAVYCGLKEFSARARAKNFSLDEMARMTAYAHQQQRRLYLTLNTLIKEEELPILVDTLAALASIGVDGIIIQDLGVWRLARRHFPELPLHASTQMTVHNPAGVKMLEKMGFVRAVLARELSLAEIAEIDRQTSIELEHFVHGALCFSISGQCLFSSYLDGTSGNRGRCAQPCRRRYFDREQAGFHFSTSDLSAIELLPALIEAGVTSLKIEGRMKGAEYVSRVVAAYRLVLDAPASSRKEAGKEAAEQLALSFGRLSTRGFLSGRAPAAIVQPSRSGGIGTPLGEVRSLAQGMLGFETTDRLHLGDRLRIQPQNDQASGGFTVRELLVEGKKRKVAKAGEFVRVRIPEKGGFYKTGDQVFKVGGKLAFTLDPEACRARLDALPMPILKSKQREERVRATLADLPPKRLAPTETQCPALGVRGRGTRDLALLSDPQLAWLELPLTPANLSGLLKASPRQLDKNRLLWELPPVLFGGEWEEYRRAVRILVGQGFTRFRLNNLGQIPLFAGLNNLQLLGGFRCQSMNSQAVLAWQELGLSELTASIEDDRKNLGELFGHTLPIPLSLTVYAPIPLLLSRIPLRSLGPNSLLRSERDEAFRIKQEDGLTEVCTEEDFSLTGLLREIRAFGCDRIIADLSHCGALSARGKEVLAAIIADQALSETTTFNYRRGLT